MIHEHYTDGVSPAKQAYIMIHFQGYSGTVIFCHTLLVFSEIDNNPCQQLDVAEKIVDGPF